MARYSLRGSPSSIRHSPLHQKEVVSLYGDEETDLRSHEIWLTYAIRFPRGGYRHFWRWQTRTTSIRPKRREWNPEHHHIPVQLYHLPKFDHFKWHQFWLAQHFVRRPGVQMWRHNNWRLPERWLSGNHGTREWKHCEARQMGVARLLGWEWQPRQPRQRSI